jgi:phage-related protein
MGIDLKPIKWLGTTRDDIRGQRPAIRDELGQQLLRVQMGLIYVLHVFTKKSRRTPKTDIDLAKKRYREARDG